MDTEPTNLLLSSLPSTDYQKLFPLLNRVHLPQGTVLSEPGAKTADAFFPLTAVLSFISETIDGHAIEVGMVGREGVMGLSSVLAGFSPYRSVVQVAGDALRLDAEKFKAEFEGLPSLNHAVLNYITALLVLISQTIVCNRFHDTPRRLARWILVTRDRIPTDEMALTHEYLSHMLGARRPSVTLALQVLAEKNLIRHRRARIEILDRPALEQYSCECYPVIKDAFQRSRQAGVGHPPVR
jgi:CRP-like cAMP-binding protein